MYMYIYTRIYVLDIININEYMHSHLRNKLSAN